MAQVQIPQGQGSTLNKTYTMLMSFHIFNILQSFSDFPTYVPYNRPVFEQLRPRLYNDVLIQTPYNIAVSYQ